MIKNKQKNTISSVVTLGVVAIMVLSAPLALLGNTSVYGNSFAAQEKAINGQIGEYEKTAERLGKKVTSLEATLQRLTAQYNKARAELRLTQVRYDAIGQEIKKTEADIKQNQDALGDVLSELYIAQQVTPFEMLASSKNISDYVDRQTYQNVIRDSLQEHITSIDQLKKSLEAKQAEIGMLLTRQKSQERSLAAKQKEQSDLVRQTKGEQRSYQQLVDESRRYLKDMSAQQREFFERRQATGSARAGVIGDIAFSDWSGNTPCGGGYPSKWCSIGQDTVVDNWGLYNRECVSYSAWRASSMGKYVGNFNGQGNAMEWPDSAVAFSGAEIVTKPKVGDVAIMPAIPGLAPIGHSMNVEKIIDDTTVVISQYNFYGSGEYSTMKLKTSGITFLRFQDR